MTSKKGYILFLLISFPLILCSLQKEEKELSFALLGDSMTWIGGDSCQNPTGWNHYLKEAFPGADIRVFARSGATWTNSPNTRRDIKAYSTILDDQNVIYNQVGRLISDSSAAPDIIIIYAGANDAWFQNKRPGIFSDISLPEGPVSNLEPKNFNSLASSIELSLRLLKENFPNSKIILISPIEMTKVEEARIKKVADIIESTGKKHGVETLRADKFVDIRKASESRNHRFTYDGVHTSPEGAKKIADFVISYLNNN